MLSAAAQPFVRSFGAPPKHNDSGKTGVESAQESTSSSSKLWSEPVIHRMQLRPLCRLLQAFFRERKQKMANSVRSLFACNFTFLFCTCNFCELMRRDVESGAVFATLREYLEIRRLGMLLRMISE